MRIDIVIELSTTDGELVLGIENKIDAREREKQLSTHQEALLRVFPNRICVMAFLTPTGRRGITASECAVPCVDIGYELVLKAVHKTMQDAKERSDKRVLEEVAAHLEEEILEKREVHRIVRDIWAAHPRALEFLFEHRPRIEDVHISFEGKLRERFGSDAQFTHYPTRGHMREIKMHLESWSSRGFPFTFMLYASDGEPPHVRVLLFKDGYEEFRSPLTRWARDVNREHGSVIDEQFAPLPDWNKQWRRVLAEEYYPPSAVLDERAFDGATAEAAAERVIALVEFLRPHVEKMTT